MVEKVKLNFLRDMSVVFCAAVIVTHAKSTVTNYSAEKPIPANMPAIRTTQVALPYSELGRPSPNPANDHLNDEATVIDTQTIIPTFMEPIIPVKAPVQLPIVPSVISNPIEPTVVVPTYSCTIYT